MNLKRSILAGMAGGLLLTAANIAISFMQLRILLHYLPEMLVGIWLVFANLGSYVSLLDLGLTQTLGREVSFAVGRQDLTAEERNARLGGLIGSCTRVMLLLGALAYLLGATLGWQYVKSVTPSALHTSLHAAWLVFFTSSALNLVGEGWYAGLFGTGHVFAEKLVRTSGLVLGFSLLVCAVAFGWGIFGLACASVAQAICTLAGARAVLARTAPAMKAYNGVDWRLVLTLLGPGVKYSATMLGGVLILQTDNLVIASTLGTQLIPNYQAVAKIVTAFMTLSMMLVVTTSPFMSQAHAKQDYGTIRRLLGQNQRVCLSVLITLGSCLACFADRALHLWLGPGHFIGFGVVWILLTVMLLEAHHLSMAVATMATGKIVFAVPALIAGVLNLVLSVVLAHRFGVVGVALGTLCAQILTNNWYVPFYTMRQLGLPLRQHLRRVVGPIVLLLTVTLTTGTFCRLLTRSLPDAPTLLISCAAIGLAGAAVMYTVVLQPADRLALTSRLRLPVMRPAVKQ